MNDDYEKQYGNTYLPHIFRATHIIGIQTSWVKLPYEIAFVLFFQLDSGVITSMLATTNV